MRTAPIIQCAICAKPIEEIFWDTRPDTRKTIYTVSCHGDTETCELSDQDLIMFTSFEGGIAFSTKRIEAIT